MIKCEDGEVLGNSEIQTAINQGQGLTCPHDIAPNYLNTILKDLDDEQDFLSGNA